MTETATTTVGERLRERRIDLGLSQRDLAEPGISYAYISRIEGGARVPSVKALRKLAPKLGVSAHWLETGEPDPAEHLAEALMEILGLAQRPGFASSSGRCEDALAAIAKEALDALGGKS